MKEIHHSPKRESIIGESSHITGKLQFKTAMRIKGKFDGEIAQGGDLVIERTSATTANVNIDNLELHGKLVGNVTATNQVNITEQATIEGNISAKAINIAQGAKLKGTISMLNNSDSIDIFSARPEQLKKLVLKI